MRGLISAVLIISAFNVNAQSPFENKNNVQLELGGHGMLYSLGFERILINSSRFKTAAKLAGAYYPPSTGYLEFWMPLSISEIISFGSHHIELGAGYTFINEQRITVLGEETREWNGFITPSAYYRYQKPNGKIMLKAGFTPFFEKYGDGYDFHPSGGLAVGYCF